MSNLPPLAQTWLQIADDAKESGAWGTLQFYAMKILQETPTDPDGRRLLGIAYAMQGRIDEGVAEHEKALRLAPNDASMWHDYGVTLIRLVTDKLAETSLSDALLDQAQEKLQRSIELDPQCFISYRNLLKVYVSRFTGRSQDEARNQFFIDHANQLVANFFNVFGPNYPLSIDLQTLDLPDGGILNCQQRIEVEITKDPDDGCIVVQNDDLNVYGLAQIFWESYLQFGDVCATLYKEFVLSGDPLSESGQEFADRLRAALKT